MNRTQPIPQKFLEQKKRGIVLNKSGSLQNEVMDYEEVKTAELKKIRNKIETSSQVKQTTKLDQQKSKTTNMTDILRKLNQTDNAANN